MFQILFFITGFLSCYNFIFRILFSKIFYSTPRFFLFRYNVERLNKFSRGFDLIFTIILEIIIINSELYFEVFY
jgi:hypothetical protein